MSIVLLPLLLPVTSFIFGLCVVVISNFPLLSLVSRGTWHTLHLFAQEPYLLYSSPFLSPLRLLLFSPLFSSGLSISFCNGHAFLLFVHFHASNLHFDLRLSAFIMLLASHPSFHALYERVVVMSICPSSFCPTICPPPFSRLSLYLHSTCIKPFFSFSPFSIFYLSCASELRLSFFSSSCVFAV